MNDRALLKESARTFYLSLRLLPAAVREEASLGYLLARATDTVADDPSRRLADRVAILRSVRSALENAEAPALAVDWPVGGEGLVAAWPRLWESLLKREKASRERLARVLRHILEGQMFDLERFGAGTAAPLSRAELERYTYLVAGSVGEFWTDLCAEKLGNFSPESLEVMKQRGQRFGQGLQLVNILRDRQEDQRMGRVYVAPGAIDDCLEQARGFLVEGAVYCAALGNGRLRYASFLPALLGLRTLVLLTNRASASCGSVKLTRGEVRYWMWRALPVLVWRQAVMPLARAASIKQS